MDPLAVFSLDNTLRAEDYAVAIILGEGIENRLDSLYGKLLGSLTTEA